MKTSMSFKEYVEFLKSYSNRPVTLNRLTLPFGIISDSIESETVLVGHVLDDLATRFAGKDQIDCIDAAATAYDLGHEPAGGFLDQAPYILSRMAQALGVGRIH